MTYKPDELCHCGHKRDLHTHFRSRGHAVDCGQCGAPVCSLFTSRRMPPVNEAQRRAGEAADREMHRNLLALLPFTRPLDASDPKLPIPVQQDRRMSITDVLAARRRAHSERSRRGRAR